MIQWTTVLAVIGFLYLFPLVWSLHCLRSGPQECRSAVIRTAGAATGALGNLFFWSLSSWGAPALLVVLAADGAALLMMMGFLVLVALSHDPFDDGSSFRLAISYLLMSAALTCGYIPRHWHIAISWMVPALSALCVVLCWQGFGCLINALPTRVKLDALVRLQRQEAAWHPPRATGGLVHRRPPGELAARYEQNMPDEGQ